MKNVKFEIHLSYLYSMYKRSPVSLQCNHNLSIFHVKVIGVLLNRPRNHKSPLALAADSINCPHYSSFNARFMARIYLHVIRVPGSQKLHQLPDEINNLFRAESRLILHFPNNGRENRVTNCRIVWLLRGNGECVRVRERYMCTCNIYKGCIR